MTHTKLIFVGGIARSGTTLAQNVLDSHPDVRGLPEFFMTVPIAGLRPKFQDLIDREMITDIYASNARPTNGCAGSSKRFSSTGPTGTARCAM